MAQKDAVLLSTLAIGLTCLQGSVPDPMSPPKAFKDLTELWRSSALGYQFKDLVAEGKFVEADRFLVANLLPKPPEPSGNWLRGALIRYELQDYEEALQRFILFRSQFPWEEDNDMANLLRDLVEAFIVHARRGNPDRAVLRLSDAYGVEVEECLNLVMGYGLEFSPAFARQIIACHRRLFPDSLQPQMEEDRVRERWGRLASGP